MMSDFSIWFLGRGELQSSARVSTHDHGQLFVLKIQQSLAMGDRAFNG